MRRFLIAAGVVALCSLGLDASRAATTSPDDRTVTDGTRSLAVSMVRDLNPDSEIVTVDGSGFDTSKGIYLAFCLIPPPGQKPSPCGGGDDRDGASGGSLWISSEVTSRSLGSQAYDDGGAFHARMNIKAVINETIDCRSARCAVVTRNDHTRGDDRSQDLIVPVTFRTTSATTAAPPGVTATTLPPPTLPTTTTTTTPPALAAPAATVADDGTAVTAGGKTLSASAVRDLAANQKVTVKGQGFDPNRGIYVSLCAQPETAGGAPGPCQSGSAGTSAWVSSNPPEYGQAQAVPYAAGGGFDLELTVQPLIDDDHDCRVIACVLATRNDDTNAADRTQDLLLPVSFSSTKPVAASASRGDGGFPLALPLVAGLFVAAVAVVWRRRTVSAALVVGLLVSACGAGAATNNVGAVPTLVENPSPTLPVTVASADGRRVTISDISRMVPLWGNLSETVFALGLGDRVVARDISTTFEQARDLPLVTRSHEVTAEAVLSQHPTLVLADEQSGPPEALRQIRDAGVPVIVFKRPTNVAEIGSQIRRVATALGVKDQGAAVAADAIREIDNITAALPHPTKRPRVAFLYMRGSAGVALIAGPGSGVDSMINSAGGRDAGTAIKLTKTFTPLTSEALVKAKPDVILMTTTGLASVGGIDGLLQVPGVAQTPAGRDRRIVTMEDGLLFSFGTRTAGALRTLSDAFYQS